MDKAEIAHKEKPQVGNFWDPGWRKRTIAQDDLNNARVESESYLEISRAYPESKKNAINMNRTVRIYVLESDDKESDETKRRDLGK